MKVLACRRGGIPLPTFLPDATAGMVRAVDAGDLEGAAIDGLVMNVFHLMQKPGSSTIQALGGIHRMAGWRRPIITDSGGFQAYSLIGRDPRAGSVSDRGLSFRPEAGGRRFLLTPEKSVSLQVAYGSDVVICLDDCTHPDDPLDVQRRSVGRTVSWGLRCRREFDRQVEMRELAPETRPLLFAVIQGGSDQGLRRRCAESLLAVGFDGYGFGGWPVTGSGELFHETLAYCRSLVPAETPMHGLGIGHPANVVAGAALGYDIFDSSLPTRDARRGRLYVATGSPAAPHGTLYIHDRKHVKSGRPISEGCDCHTCVTYTVGYLHHLHRCEDALFLRLATIHNLRFMSSLMQGLRGDGG